MKKQTKIIIGIVLGIALAILVVSLVYPPVFKGLTSGTFGKADKYHKEQMTEKDIQLRSEFIQDTAQLRSMIQGLIYFSLFSQNLSYTIDTCVKTFQLKGICDGKSVACQNMGILEDYSTFIKNNTKTLNSTVRMLTDFYLKDTTDQSVDVEKNIRDFGNYVNQLNSRDSVVENALYSMDGYILSPEMKKVKQTELASLKSIRDQLLIRGIQLSGLLQDKPLSSNLIGYALSSQIELGRICGIHNLGVGYDLGSSTIKGQQLGNQLSSQLSSIVVGSRPIGNVSDGQLQQILQGSQLSGTTRVHGDLSSLLNSGIVVYDKPTLGFYFCSGNQLGAIKSASALNQQQLGSLTGVVELKGQYMSSLSSMGAIGVVAYCSNQGLQVMQSSADIKSALSSGLLGTRFDAVTLGVVLQGQDLGSLVFGSQFVGAINQLGSLGLGVTPLGVFVDN